MYHALALTDSGQLFSWGYNSSGQLGHGNVRDHHAPKHIENLRHQCVCGVAAGTEHSIAVTSAGLVFTWGDGQFGKLGHGDSPLDSARSFPRSHVNIPYQHTPKVLSALRDEHATYVAAGCHHSLASTLQGTLYTWGGGKDGKLGHGDLRDHNLPKRVTGLSGQSVRLVDASSAHSVAVTASGQVYAWGSGEFGRLGHGDVSDQLLPKIVEALAHERVSSVSASFAWSVAVTDSGRAFGWGKILDGLQRQSLEPEEIYDCNLAKTVCGNNVKLVSIC